MRRIEVTPLALGQVERGERKAADRRPLQSGAVVAGGNEHALHLVVLPLFEHDLEPVRIDLAADLGPQRRRLCLLYTSPSPRDS